MVGCSTIGTKNQPVFTEDDAEYFRKAQGKLATGEATTQAESLIAMARFYADAQRLPLAERMYEKALKADPKCVPAHIGLIKLQVENSQWDRAEASLARARQLVPNSAAIWNEAAALEAKRKNLFQAISFAQRARDLAPEVDLYRTNLANLYLSVGKTDLAVAEFSHIMGPQKARAHVDQLMSMMVGPQPHSTRSTVQKAKKPGHESDTETGWGRSHRTVSYQAADDDHPETLVPAQQSHQGWRTRTASVPRSSTAHQEHSKPTDRGTVAVVDDEVEDAE
jgi:tetratricopeptide (TPR) repeat protein